MSLAELIAQGTKVKFDDGKVKVSGRIAEKGKRIYLSFPYSKTLLEEIKAFDGAKYHGNDENHPVKAWSIANNARNDFQLRWLLGENPYAPYDAPLNKHDFSRPLYAHQHTGASFGLTRRRCIIAAEMGCGKTLEVIEIMEQSGSTDWLYVAPNSALNAVQLEFAKWDFKLQPKLITYERLRILWENDALPNCESVVFDESARLKNPDAKRTQAAMALADMVREKNGFIILLSGAPAPRSPADWWSQCEIACPGFLKEGTLKKFVARLSVSAKRETEAGVSYTEHVAWLDEEGKCSVCGMPKDDGIHDKEFAASGIGDAHEYTSAQNEVAKLYDRLQGLVLVQRKKDCLDLPDKVFQNVVLEPTPKTLQLARAIVAGARTTIEALTLLRELSDGFQYRDVKDGTTRCEACKGEGEVDDFVEGGAKVRVPCWICKGEKVVPRIVRTVKTFATPKEDALKDDLDSHEDVGRLVIYAGFQGSIDRIVRIVQEQKWDFIRVDGRGWESSLVDDSISMLKRFQDKEDKARIAFVGHAKSAGTGLTLTASPTCIFYSNSFDADDYIQACDRIHRPGMDINRGATIKHYLHLETDLLILENLQRKQDLQGLTLGELGERLNGMRTEQRSY